MRQNQHHVIANRPALFRAVKQSPPHWETAPAGKYVLFHSDALFLLSRGKLLSHSRDHGKILKPQNGRRTGWLLSVAQTQFVRLSI
jgi:hypothetical protein